LVVETGALESMLFTAGMRRQVAATLEKLRSTDWLVTFHGVSGNLDNNLKMVIFCNASTVFPCGCRRCPLRRLIMEPVGLGSDHGARFGPDPHSIVLSAWRKNMRKSLIALSTLASAVLLPTLAEATSTSYYVCWNQPSGVSQCANLPDSYRIRGVAKPYCDSRGCSKGSVDFTLTKSTISCLSMYTDTSTMKPTNWATVYAPSR
jgi:hypothetical protein